MRSLGPLLMKKQKNFQLIKLQAQNVNTKKTLSRLPKQKLVMGNMHLMLVLGNALVQLELSLYFIKENLFRSVVWLPFSPLFALLILT
jgi:hypothetical protein